MLKPSDPGPGPADPGSDRSVSELVHQLVEDGKAYAKAEVGVVKAIASSKAGALAIPAALLAVAFLLAQGGINALAVGILLAIGAALGPLLGGILAFLIFMAAAGGLAWFAIQKVRKDL
jgi:hypothetical protein